jgi:hypothetical protein
MIEYYQDFVIYTNYIDGYKPDKNGTLEKFSLCVLYSPQGEGEYPVEINIDKWNSLLNWQTQLAKREINSEDFIKFAETLGNMILPSWDYPREMYRSSLNLVQNQDTVGLRVRLRLIPELAYLAWEYALIKLHSGEITQADYWSQHHKVSIVRHEQIFIPAAPFRSGPKRRVIIAMASPKPFSKYPKLNLTNEQLEIKSELSNLDGVETNYYPDFNSDTKVVLVTKEMIQNVLSKKDADIFHFSGHGTYKSENGYGAIILAKSDNQAEEVKADTMSGLLADGNIRLVVLTTCESAKGAMSLEWSSIAKAILKRGIPAVIAMQFTVYDDLMKTFVKKLYHYLVDQMEIDQAVSLARRSLYDHHQNPRDWGAPVLYLRNTGGIIFPPITDEEALSKAKLSFERDFVLSEVSMRLISEGILATPDQLEFLKVAGEPLDLKILDTLLLLKSSLYYDQDTGYWVKKLSHVGIKWLQKLRDKTTIVGDDEFKFEDEQLGLRDLEQRPEQVDILTWSAVKQSDLLKAQTAALALLASENEKPEKVISDIEEGLFFVKNKSKQRMRRGILLGTLAESDPIIDENLSREVDNLQDRYSIWMWRVRKHIRQTKQKIIRWTLGGALGAAIALAIYRSVLAIVNAQPIGTEFAIYSYWGFIIGFGLVLGKVLAEPLLLQNPDSAKPYKYRRVIILSTLLGAIGFSLANGLVAKMNGLEISLNTFLRLLIVSFIVGAILSLGLLNQPKAGWNLGWLRWFKRLGFVAILLAIIQLPALCEATTNINGSYIFDNVEWLGSSIIEPSQSIVDKYRLYPCLDLLFNKCVPGEIGKCCFQCPIPIGNSIIGSLFGNCFEQLLTALDAAFVGIVLIVGISFGFHFKDTWLGIKLKKCKFRLGL